MYAREYGPPTLFLTFSCAEYQSADISGSQKSQKCPRQLSHWEVVLQRSNFRLGNLAKKIHDLFATVIMKGHVLGTVSHYFVKKEYQARGALHYHMVLWIEGAPTIGKDAPAVVLKWIQERISCRIHDEATSPELHQLLTRYQMHKCSSYCKRTKKVSKAFVTICKFGFTRTATNDGALKCVEDCLQSRQKSTAFHELTVRYVSMTTVLCCSCCGRPTWTSSSLQSLCWVGTLRRGVCHESRAKQYAGDLARGRCKQKHLQPSVEFRYSKPALA